LQEKTDKVNQLSLLNEQLERALDEKEEANATISQALKEAEKIVELYRNEKSENEKLKDETEKVKPPNRLNYICVFWDNNL
jgi:hypothetical protein